MYSRLDDMDLKYDYKNESYEHNLHLAYLLHTLDV